MRVWRRAFNNPTRPAPITGAGAPRSKAAPFKHARAIDAIGYHTTWFRVRDGAVARAHCALGWRLQRRVARGTGMAVPDRIEILSSADDLLLLSGSARRTYCRADHAVGSGDRAVSQRLLDH